MRGINATMDRASRNDVTHQIILVHFRGNKISPSRQLNFDPCFYMNSGLNCMVWRMIKNIHENEMDMKVIARGG